MSSKQQKTTTQQELKDKSEIAEQSLEIDKSKWGPGPWMDEPDRVQYYHEETGYTCLIVRADETGALCGYVGVPPGHPLHGVRYSSKIKPDWNPQFNGNYIGLLIAASDKDYTDGWFRVDSCLEVHGGITYSRFCNEEGKICHVPYEGEPDKVWWLGFDCAHAGDFSPAHEAMFRETGSALAQYSRPYNYKDIEFVRRENYKLAVQLKAMEGKQFEVRIDTDLEDFTTSITKEKED